MTHRLAIPCRRHSHVVRFVADVYARGSGMQHFQADVFTLDFPYHLPSLLPIHLLPTALPRAECCWECPKRKFRTLPCCLVLSGCLDFMLTFSTLNSTWLGPVGENYTFSPAGSGPYPFQDNAATIYTIANNRSHAGHRAGTLQSKNGLNCRAMLCLGF